MRTLVFKDYLKQHAKVVQKKATLPICETILIGNGRMVSTDLERFFVTEIPEIKDMPEVCVNHDKLYKVINSIKSNSFTMGSEDSGIDEPGSLKFVLRYNGTEFKLGTRMKDEFPLIPKDLFIKIDELSEWSVKKVKIYSNFVSDDQKRPIMNGVYVRKYIVATDSFRMAFIKRTEMDIENNIMPYVIPSNIIPLLSNDKIEVFITKSDINTVCPEKNRKTIFDRIATPNEKVNYSPALLEKYLPEINLIYNTEMTAGRYNKFVWKEHTIISRCVDGVFPYFYAVIPNINNIIQIPKETLLTSIEQAKIIANKNTEKIDFAIIDKYIKLYTIDENNDNEYNSNINCHIIEESKEFDGANGIWGAFKASYLLSILKFIPDKLTIGFSIIDNSKYNNRGMIISNEFLLMPIETSNKIGTNIKVSEVVPDEIEEEQPIEKVKENTNIFEL